MLNKAAILNFRPTAAMISLTENLLIAMAHRDTVSPVVEAYQRKILEEGNYQRDPKWRTYDLGGSERITDPKDTHLMPDDRFLEYHAACNEARKAAGLHVENDECCPKLVSENTVIQLENLLMIAFKPLTGLDQPIRMELRRKYLDILIRMMMEHVKPQARLNRYVGRTA